MKLISLHEWLQSSQGIFGNRLLESDDDDMVQNILRLIASPDGANYEMAKEIVNGQFKEDNPRLYKKFLDLFQTLEMMYKRFGMSAEIDMDQSDNFVPIFNSGRGFKVESDMVENGKLIYKFGKITGYFILPFDILTSLDGCPQEVGGMFNCSRNMLTSLEGGPTKVGGDYYCSKNKLSNLKGSPVEVGKNFFCSDNQLSNLEGAPQKVGGNFVCQDSQLSSLDGGPEFVGGDFCCIGNKLESLEGAPKEVKGGFYCKGNLIQFTEADVRAVCNVHGAIHVQ